MEQIDDNSAQTVPIYNLDASSSDSDSDDPGRRGGPPVGPPVDTSTLSTLTPTNVTQTSIMSQRQRIPVPQRSYSTPLQRHERQPSELSAAAESVQTRPSVDEEYLFEEDEESTSEGEE